MITINDRYNSYNIIEAVSTTYGPTSFSGALYDAVTDYSVIVSVEVTSPTLIESRDSVNTLLIEAVTSSYPPVSFSVEVFSSGLSYLSSYSFISILSGELSFIDNFNSNIIESVTTTYPPSSFYVDLISHFNLFSILGDTASSSSEELITNISGFFTYIDYSYVFRSSLKYYFSDVSLIKCFVFVDYIPYFDYLFYDISLSYADFFIADSSIYSSYYTFITDNITNFLSNVDYICNYFEYIGPCNFSFSTEILSSYLFSLFDNLYLYDYLYSYFYTACISGIKYFDISPILNLFSLCSSNFCLTSFFHYVGNYEYSLFGGGVYFSDILFDFIRPQELVGVISSIVGDSIKLSCFIRDFNIIEACGNFVLSEDGVYVVDTSVDMDDGKIIYRFGDFGTSLTKRIEKVFIEGYCKGIDIISGDGEYNYEIINGVGIIGRGYNFRECMIRFTGIKYISGITFRIIPYRRGRSDS